LPDDLAAAHAVILAQWNARRQAEAMVSAASLEIQRLKLLLAKARRDAFGQTSERAKRLLDQLELQLAELEEAVAEDDVAADLEAATSETVVAEHIRHKPARRPLPAHLPRERVVIPAPTSCPCCGGPRLSKVGEAVTETLDVVPRRWFVRQTVREKFSCRDCERISEPPAPFHVIPRGRIGASLLAMILFEKYGQHQPLNRQSERYAREGIDLDLSTLADLVGTATAVLAPLHELIRQHVLGAERLHGDDTPVPVLAKGKTATGRLWAYVRDDRPFGQGRPAALFHYSPDRRGDHPNEHLAGYAGTLQAVLMPASADSINLPVLAGLSSRPSAGRMHAGASSSSPTSPKPGKDRLHPWRWRPSARSMPSLPRNARSMAARPRSGWPVAERTSRPWSPSSRPGCAPSAPGCRAMPTSLKPSITC